MQLASIRQAVSVNSVWLGLLLVWTLILLRHSLRPTRLDQVIINKPLIVPRNRTELGSLLDELGFRTGAELGVQRGYFSEEVLTQWSSCETYWLVDIWKHQSNYRDGANVNDKTQQSFFEVRLLAH